MNYIYPYLKPFLDVWEDLTIDRRFKELTEVPGDWHTKWLSNERYRVNDEFKENLRRFNEEPSLTDFLWDNKYRFTLLAFVERLYNLRQAQNNLKERYAIPNSNIGALNVVREGGIFRGALKGNLLNLFHFIGVHYHALLYAGNDPKQYLLYTTLFELAFYPLDTLRTYRYADVNKQFKNTLDCVTQTVAKGGLSQFYRGIQCKLIYNLFFGLNLWNISTDSNLVYLTFPLWVVSYGLLSLKTRLQIVGSPLSYQTGSDDKVLNHVIRRESFKGLFNGIVPFLAVNLLAAYTFPSLFSQEKKNAILSAINEKIPAPPRENKYYI